MIRKRGNLLLAIVAIIMVAVIAFFSYNSYLTRKNIIRFAAPGYYFVITDTGTLKCYRGDAWKIYNRTVSISCNFYMKSVDEYAEVKLSDEDFEWLIEKSEEALEKLRSNETPPYRLEPVQYYYGERFWTIVLNEALDIISRILDLSPIEVPSDALSFV